MSTTKKYKSPNSGEPCTFPQYAAELLCAREAKKKKIDLGLKFWNTEAWKKKFTTHIVSVNKKLKKYDAQAILNALKRKDMAWALSLFIPAMDTAIKEEQRKLDKEAAKPKVVLEFEDNTEKQPIKPKGKKTTLSKLRELDD